MRIVLHITSSVTASRDPRINLVITEIIAVFLLILSTHKIYKGRHVKTIEIISFSNIALVCIALLYFYKVDKGQQIVTYISGSITLGLLIIVLSYHLLNEICCRTYFGRILKQKIKHQFKNRDNDAEVNLISIINTPQDNDTRMVPTFSVVDPPSPRESDSLPVNENNVQSEYK